MTLRWLAVILATAVFGTLNVAEAKDVSPREISAWLCENLGKDPRQVLASFPQAGTAEPLHQEKQGVTKTTSRRGPREYVAHTWTMTTSDFEVKYHYLTNDRHPEGYGFDVDVKAESSLGNAVIFSSDTEARSWVSRLGGRCAKDDDTTSSPHEWTVCIYNNDPRLRDMVSVQVTVDVEFQGVKVEWQDPEDLPQQRFCSR